MADTNDRALIKAVGVLRRFDDVEALSKCLAMILDGYLVVRVSSLHYQISKPNAEPYNVRFDKMSKKPQCDCPARKTCKHIEFMNFLGTFLPQMVTHD